MLWDVQTVFAGVELCDVAAKLAGYGVNGVSYKYRIIVAVVAHYESQSVKFNEIVVIKFILHKSKVHSRE